MGIKVKEEVVESDAERLLCIGLIASDIAIKQIAPILEPNFMTARYTRYIVTWCLNYYKKFGCAPGVHIQDIFESHKRKDLDPDIADIIESLLIDLNDQLVGKKVTFNEQYVIEQSENFIKSRKALMLCEDVTNLLSTGRILDAEGLLANYNIPRRPDAEADDVFAKTFWSEEEEEHNCLFKFPGELHRLVGDIERDSFISLLAPEKRGKTWILLWLALLAYRQRCNVVFYSIGDMTTKQVKRRLRHMLTTKDPKRDRKKVKAPVLDCYHNQFGECPLGEDTDPVLLGGKGKIRELGNFEDFPDHVPCIECFRNRQDRRHFIGRPWWKIQKVEAKPIHEIRKALLKQSGKRSFRLATFPPASVSVTSLESHLDILQQQYNFIPDVIIIDYADLFEPAQEDRKLDFRNQINATWMKLRALSQKRNCAVITATQAKIETRRKSQVDQWDTAEDKRKLAHVTAMLALNQTPEEKRKGIMRISNIATRDDDFDTELNVAVLQCLQLGKPYIISYPYKDDPLLKRNKKVENNER